MVAHRTSDDTPTDERRVSVLPPTAQHVRALRVCDEQVRARKGLEDAARGLAHEHGAVEVAFAHVVHVDRVQDRARGRRADLPYRAPERVSGFERRDSEALTFPYENKSG